MTFCQQKIDFSYIVKIEVFKTHPKVHENHLSNCIVNAGCKRSILKSFSEKWSSTFSQSSKITNCFLCVIVTDKSAFNSLSLSFCCKVVTSVLNYFLEKPSQFWLFVSWRISVYSLVYAQSAFVGFTRNLF